MSGRMYDTEATTASQIKLLSCSSHGFKTFHQTKLPWWGPRLDMRKLVRFFAALLPKPAQVSFADLKVRCLD